MTNEGRRFIDEYKKGNVLLETLQIVYNKNHITEQEFKETTGQEPEEKQVEENTEKTLMKQIADLKIDNMKKDSIINNTLKTIAELKVQVMELKGGN